MTDLPPIPDWLRRPASAARPLREFSPEVEARRRAHKIAQEAKKARERGLRIRRLKKRKADLANQRKEVEAKRNWDG